MLLQASKKKLFEPLNRITFFEGDWQWWPCLEKFETDFAEPQKLIRSIGNSFLCISGKTWLEFARFYIHFTCVYWSAKSGQLFMDKTKTLREMMFRFMCFRVNEWMQEEGVCALVPGRGHGGGGVQWRGEQPQRPARRVPAVRGRHRGSEFYPPLLGQNGRQHNHRRGGPTRRDRLLHGVQTLNWTEPNRFNSATEDSCYSRDKTRQYTASEYMVWSEHKNW